MNLFDEDAMVSTPHDVIMNNTHVDGSICIDSVRLYPDEGGKLFHK
jgi:hypothetical protein